ncbi:concanavalin A-like lectin/glucanase domain-containing protein [Chlamydoabsidia padenii]|nr:concanavalin A-like lectin/glucanase domain-containing protein [Chlamydoabsidia padenii]
MLSCWLVILFFCTRLRAQLAPDTIDDPCDCGYYDPTSKEATIWTNGWYMHFDSQLGNTTTTTTDINLSHPPTSFSRLEQDFFMANYEIGAKYEDTYSRIFSVDNVKMDNNALQLAVTTDPTVRCGAIGTKRQDILYGSFSSRMRLTKTNGTVQAMYFYNPDGEIDIEILGAVTPPQAYFAIHPGLQEPNGRASALTHDNHLLGFDPTDDFHDYRFDWYPNRTEFYIDHQLAHTLVTRVPQTPGRFMFSHWTDGNIKFSKGPPESDAIMEIKSFVALFNTTDEPMSCQRSQQACNIQDVLNGQTSSSPSIAIPPTMEPTSINLASSDSINTLNQSYLVGILLLFGCTVILL